MDSELLRFDDNLRHPLSSICNASISDQSWLQATLPCSLGGLSLREASRASPAAFLGCCVSSFALCSQLLSSFSGYSITLSSIPGEELAIAHLSASLSGTLEPEVPASQLSEAQRIFQSQLDPCQSNSLWSSCSLRDQARIHAISSHSCATAWLGAIPSVSLGLSYHVQTGVYVFSLVLAWNSNFLFYRFCSLLLWQHGGPVWRPSSWVRPWPNEDSPP